MDRINLSVLLALFLIVIFSPSVLSVPSDWWGNVTIISGSTTNTSTNGAVIASLINNVSDNTFDIVGTPDSGYYLIHVNCNSGQKVKFQVYGVNASPTNLTAQDCLAEGGSAPQLNLLAHLVANTGTCPASYPTQPGTGNIHNGCSGGFCVHNICRAAATNCGDGFCDTGESCSSDDSACSSGFACTNGCVATTSTSSSGSTGGGGGGGGAATTTPTPTPTPTPSPGAGAVSPVNIPVTGSEEKSQIIQPLSAGALGLTTLSAAEVDVTQTGEASASISTDTQAVLDTITTALSSSSGSAQAALQEAKSQLSGGSSQTLAIQVKLEVFEVKARATGQKTAVSKITLTFSTDTAKQDVKIIEIIPKSVASSASSVKFIGEAPQILQSDPIVQWSFDDVPAGTRKDLSYTVNKNLTSLSPTTVATAGVPAPPPQQACQPGSRICIDGQTLGTCRSDGSGYDQTPCSYGCESGACKSQPAPPLPPQEFPWLMIVIIIIIVVVIIALVAATRRKKTYSFGKR